MYGHLEFYSLNWLPTDVFLIQVNKYIFTLQINILHIYLMLQNVESFVLHLIYAKT